MRVVPGLTWLLGCQLVGEAVAHLTGAPVPGPVIGMGVLLLVLLVRRTPDGSPVHEAADVLLPHLQLLFVPAGVGLVAYGAVLRDDGPALAAALVGSWLLALAAVGWTAQLLTRSRA